MEAKLSANAAGKIGGLMEFMKKIIDHPTGIIEEGGAALPIKSFVLHVGEQLDGPVFTKIKNQLDDFKEWKDIIPIAARKISSEVLK